MPKCTKSLRDSPLRGGRIRAWILSQCRYLKTCTVADAECDLDRHFAEGASASERKVSLRPSPALLLAKALQHLEVKPDPLSPPVLGFPQSSPRFLADPRFHPENHDLMQPLASGVELQ
jgi:hypothetical protein